MISITLRDPASLLKHNVFVPVAVVVIVVWTITPATAQPVNRNPTAAGNLQLDSSHGGQVFVNTNEPIAAYAWFSPSFLFYQRRGIIEFNLSTISPLPNNHVDLILPDTGGFGSADSTTFIYWYTSTADGVLSTGDWDSPTTFVTSITRPGTGPATTLDITSLVNSLGAVNVGFRFEALNDGTWNEDAFGGSYLQYDPNPVTLPGDYNGDGSVDAADYTVWRDELGSTFNLSGNGDETGMSAGVVDDADYDYWKANFGAPPGSGSTLANSVPEPATITLVLLGLLGFCVDLDR